MKKIFSLLALMSFGFGTMSKIIATSSLVDQQREPLNNRGTIKFRFILKTMIIKVILFLMIEV
ncbi:hypothetical protein [Spiroplasma sp. Moj]|uniref:hypothetical protein n=1 Tax=Spiroplasma sp. Moj TaxID=1922342 RepID=UPI0039EF3C84